ncbi:MAG: hypothetical protein ACD_3C00082G0005 [uncultured bacterium (gcode 4)]|uniref:Uncharacterized protein n=1 Tax=uncultured bacterium (gcode 4) TaxID=1234023 RepID=K2FZ89_9BACT|nr:MAG: hypothetical protein ACD_3C00082G0005 [uncultured bacterium (gcode 4)]
MILSLNEINEGADRPQDLTRRLLKREFYELLSAF